MCVHVCVRVHVYPIVNHLIIYDTNFTHVITYLLLIKKFIFNIHL
jgi:hypothetical protein